MPSPCLGFTKEIRANEDRKNMVAIKGSLEFVAITRLGILLTVFERFLHDCPISFCHLQSDTVLSCKCCAALVFLRQDKGCRVSVAVLCLSVPRQGAPGCHRSSGPPPPCRPAILEAQHATPSPEIPTKHRVHTSFFEKFARTFAFFPVARVRNPTAMNQKCLFR